MLLEVPEGLASNWSRDWESASVQRRAGGSMIHACGPYWCEPHAAVRPAGQRRSVGLSTRRPGSGGGTSMPRPASTPGEYDTAPSIPRSKMRGENRMKWKEVEGSPVALSTSLPFQSHFSLRRSSRHQYRIFESDHGFPCRIIYLKHT